MTKPHEETTKLVPGQKPPFVRTETEAEFNARKAALVAELRRMAAIEEEKKRCDQSA